MAAPTIIIENGTMPTGANSYVSLADVTTFASSYGYSLGTVDNDKLTRNILTSCDFLNGLEYIGDVAVAFREMAFPRINVEGLENTVPEQLKKAQCWLACNFYLGIIESIFEIETPQDGTDGAVKRKKVGPIEKEYFESLKSDLLKAKGSQRFPQIYNWLKPFIDMGAEQVGGIVNVVL